jgi:hypothetical protein
MPHLRPVGSTVELTGKGAEIRTRICGHSDICVFVFPRQKLALWCQFNLGAMASAP